MHKNIAVFGIYKNRNEIDLAVDRFKLEGFRNEDISCLLPDNQGTKEFAHEKQTKAPEGATTGAVTGAVLGGTLGWLVGAGAITIPGIGPFLAAGPILSALAGMGAGGAVGGFTGALVGMGIPEYEAKRYEGLIKNGSYLVSIHCDDSEWARKATRILKETGATDVSSASESKATVEGTGTDKPFPRTGTTGYF